MTKEQLETIRDFLKEKRKGYFTLMRHYKRKSQEGVYPAGDALVNYNDIAATECGVMLADVMLQLSELE